MSTTTDRRFGPETTEAGVLLLVASGVAVAAWIVHLSALASLVELSRTSAAARWTMHALTVVTTVVCILVIALGWHYLRTDRTPEVEGSRRGRTAFLARLALLVGATNLLLILFEGSYVLLIDRNA